MGRQIQHWMERLEVRNLLAATTINWNSVQQPIDGFGASSAWVTTDLTASQQQLLYSKTNGAGMTLLRSRIRPDTTASSDEIQTMLKAQAMGARIFSTPWSPPAAWKSNNDINNGGALLASHYQDYANLLGQYVGNMKAAGVTIYALSLQNEPDIATTYESCNWTAAQFAAFLPYVHNVWVSQGLSAKIIMPEEMGWHWELASTIMADPTLNSYVDIYAAHAYDGGYGPVPGAAGKQLWQTEVSQLGVSDNSIASGIWTAGQIHKSVVRSSANAWNFWWIQSNDNQGLVRETWAPTTRFWAEANFSRFVRPGWNRLGETNDGGLEISPFKNAATGDAVIVLTNPTNTPITETITLSGTYLPSLIPWVTSATQNLEQQRAIPATGTGGVHTYTVPANSIVSLVGTATAAPVTQPKPGLLAKATSRGTAALTWTGNVAGATAYTLQRSANGTTWKTLSTSIPATTLTYSDSGLSEGTLYYYRVTPTNLSAYSNISATTTLLAAPSQIGATYNPAKKSVNVFWVPSGTWPTDFAIDRSTDGGSTWTGLTSAIPFGTHSYTVTNPVLGASNVYRVRAIYGINSSDGSATVAVTTLPVTPSRPITAAAPSESAPSRPWSTGPSISSQVLQQPYSDSRGFGAPTASLSPFAKRGQISTLFT